MRRNHVCKGLETEDEGLQGHIPNSPECRPMPATVNAFCKVCSYSIGCTIHSHHQYCIEGMLRREGTRNWQRYHTTGIS